VGLDIFVEMDFQKAFEFLELKKNILNKKLIYFNELIAKNQAHYKVTDKILKELKMQIEIDRKFN
jgi:prefoldin subunit 5